MGNLILIIIVGIIIYHFVKKKDKANAEKESEDFQNYLKGFYSDYKNVALVEGIVKSIMKMDGIWIRFLRIGRPFYIELTSTSVSVLEKRFSSPDGDKGHEELIVNFLQLGLNPLSHMQIKALTFAINQALASIPWIRSFQYGSSISVEVAKGQKVPETFGCESTEIEFSVSPPETLTHQNHNRQNETLIKQASDTYKKYMDMLKTDAVKSSLTMYSICFDILVEHEMFFRIPTLENFEKLTEFINKSNKQIDYINSEDYPDKEKLQALQNIYSAASNFDKAIYNSSDELKRLDKEQIDFYTKLVPTILEENNYNSPKYRDAIAVLVACKILSTDLCYENSNLLKEKVEQLTKQEEIK
ncbi:MAG: hypothetical protein IJ391_01170 [Clostridia bacterium]|nr:hypothetical protein [Clostridia bacterium]